MTFRALRLAAPFVRAARYGVDWMLYPLRRRRALRTLTALGRPRHVLFVCNGNICRSPYAAAAYRARLGANSPDGVVVSSGGLFGGDAPAAPLGQEVAAEHGLNLSAHRSTVIDADMVARADLVVVMDGVQAGKVQVLYGARPERLVVLGDFALRPGERREIADPIGQARGAYEAAYERIGRCIEVLVRVFG